MPTNINDKRDDNFVVAGLAVNNTDGVSTIPIYMDPVTSYLKVDITQTTDATSPTSPVDAPRDENYVPVAMGISDDANMTPTPIFVDSRSGLLWVDVSVT